MIWGRTTDEIHADREVTHTDFACLLPVRMHNGQYLWLQWYINTWVPLPNSALYRGRWEKSPSSYKDSLHSPVGLRTKIEFTFVLVAGFYAVMWSFIKIAPFFDTLFQGKCF